MKKKLMLITSFGPSLINFRGDLINELIKNGYDVSVMASYFDPSTIDSLNKKNTKIFKMKMDNRSLSILQNIRAIVSVFYILLSKKPDMIIYNNAGKKKLFSHYGIIIKNIKKNKIKIY